MSKIVEELSFAVLSVAQSKNSRCSSDFLEVSQEAKIAPSFSVRPLCPATMSIGTWGVPKMPKHDQYADCTQPQGSMATCYIYDCLVFLHIPGVPKK